MFLWFTHILLIPHLQLRIGLRPFLWVISKQNKKHGMSLTNLGSFGFGWRVLKTSFFQCNRRGRMVGFFDGGPWGDVLFDPLSKFQLHNKRLLVSRTCVMQSDNPKLPSLFKHFIRYNAFQYFQFYLQRCFKVCLHFAIDNDWWEYLTRPLECTPAKSCCVGPVRWSSTWVFSL